jgi:hypothetical protein
MMKLTINLQVEIDDALSINAMKAEIVKDLKKWLASAPIMQQLAEAEDSLKVAANA